MAHYFAADHDPLDERLSDEELREVLERLGEAQFGGDERATVGAVVEATGADAATILRLLGEIRHRALEAQQMAVDRLERRVARLEEKPTPSFVSSPRNQDRFDVRPQDEAVRAFQSVVVFLVLAIMAGIFFAARASQREPSSTLSSISIPTSDGMVEMDADGRIQVRRRDGSVRDATEAEQDQIRTDKLVFDAKLMAR